MTGAFRSLFARFLSIAAVATFLIGGVAATPAHAIVVPWSGAGSSGVDGAPNANLNDTWALINGNTTWQIATPAGQFLSAPTFGPTTSVGNGLFATAFMFTFNAGAPGISSASLIDTTTGQTWNTNITASNSVTLSALTGPSGLPLSQNDAYTLDINFAGAATPNTFSFAALWSDTPISNNTSVPEPTPLSLLGVAALALFVMRKHLVNAI